MRNRQHSAGWLAGLMTGALTCAPVLGAEPVADVPATAAKPAPKEVITYLGTETRMIDDEIVNVRVALKGTASDDRVTDYLKCAVAEYTLIRGKTTARQIRTVVSHSFGRATGEAYYMVASGHPRGFERIDATAKVAECRTKGIPTL